MKKLVLLGLIVMSPLYAIADSFIVLKGPVYYKENASSKEVKVSLWGTIPSENVLIRTNGNIFKVQRTSTPKNEYLRMAPTTWTGKTLKDCIKDPEPEDKLVIAQTISKRMGEDVDNSEHEPQFHYLCAFLNQYDDSYWPSLIYDNHVIISMQNALKSLCGKQVFTTGKQYMITPMDASQQNIENHLDSILQHTGSKDRIILYLSSHGDYDKDGMFHLILKDSRYNKEDGTIENALSKTVINNYVNLLTSKGAEVLLFVDACHSGDIGDNDHVEGWAAYYLSTNKEGGAYTETSGSHFALALIDVMNGYDISGNTKNMIEKVNIAALSKYINGRVPNEQVPICIHHQFDPNTLLWKNIVKKQDESTEIKALIWQINNSPSMRTNAMVDLGNAYLYGKDSLFLSVDSAYLWFTRAKNMEGINDVVKSKALIGIYECYRRGIPSKNRAKGFEAIEEAAKLKNPEAFYKLGQCYIEGYHATKNYQEGLKWIKLSAKENYSEAQRYLGFLYFQRTKLEYGYLFRNLKKEERAQILRNSEILGAVKSERQIDGRTIYRSASGSYGRPYFMNEAIKWYTKAAKQANIQAQYELGDVYSSEFNVFKGKKDYIYAIHWYEEAERNGYADAQYKLGLMYFDGKSEGIRKDKKKAIELMRKAATQNHKEAIAFLQKYESTK